MDLWKGVEGVKTKHEYYFYVYNGEAVRSGDWKYHKKQFLTGTKKLRREGNPTLYYLKNNIGESKNVIDQHPEIAKRLANALEVHLKYIAN